MNFVDLVAYREQRLVRYHGDIRIILMVPYNSFNQLLQSYHIDLGTGEKAYWLFPEEYSIADMVHEIHRCFGFEEREIEIFRCNQECLLDL